MDHNWLQHAPLSICNHLNRTESDHSPLLVSLKQATNSSRKQFKFLYFWMQHDSFLPVVAEAWQSTNHHNALTRPGLRLSATRKALSVWSRATFGDLFQEVFDWILSTWTVQIHCSRIMALKANAVSGMVVDDECKLKFLELKAKRNFRFIVFKIDENVQRVVVDKLGQPGESYEDFTACLPADECRYAVFDFDFVTDENCQKSKIIFVAWF